MQIAQQCEVSYRLDGRAHQGKMHIEQCEEQGKTHFRAIIESSVLHGTFGGNAESIELALDFLNLAMQAEGADEIVFSCHPAQA